MKLFNLSHEKIEYNLMKPPWIYLVTCGGDLTQVETPLPGGGWQKAETGLRSHVDRGTQQKSDRNSTTRF